MNSLSSTLSGLSENKTVVFAMSGVDAEAENTRPGEGVGKGDYNGSDDEQDHKAKWILPVILLALLGVFMWYWLNHDNEAKEAAADQKDKVEMTNVADSIANAMNAELMESSGKDTAKATTEEAK